MRSKALWAVAALVVVAVVLWLILGKRDRYTESQLSAIHSLVAQIDSQYAALDRTNIDALQGFLNVTEHKGNRDSSAAMVDRAIQARIPMLAPIRKNLDSLSRLTRDTASSFTKGIELYVQSTGQAVQQLESQAGLLGVVHDTALMGSHPIPPTATPIPGTPNVIVPGVVEAPYERPINDNIRGLKYLNEERAKAKAIIAEGYK